MREASCRCCRSASDRGKSCARTEILTAMPQAVARKVGAASPGAAAGLAILFEATGTEPGALYLRSDRGAIMSGYVVIASKYFQPYVPSATCLVRAYLGFEGGTIAVSAQCVATNGVWLGEEPRYHQ